MSDDVVRVVTVDQCAALSLAWVAQKLRQDGFAGNDLIVRVSCRAGASAEVAV